MTKGTDTSSFEQQTFQRMCAGMYRYYANKRTETRKQDGHKYKAYLADYFEDEAKEGIAPLDFVKQCKRKEILAYDSSEEVNRFYLGGQPIWLDKETRASLRMRLNAEESAGETITSLWYEGNRIVLPIATARNMLETVELHAAQCYDNTQAHLSNVAEGVDADAVFNYDHTSGYPEKPDFPVPNV